MKLSNIIIVLAILTISFTSCSTVDNVNFKSIDGTNIRIYNGQLNLIQNGDIQMIFDLNLLNTSTEKNRIAGDVTTVSNITPSNYDSRNLTYNITIQNTPNNSEIFTIKFECLNTGKINSYMANVYNK